MFRVRTSAFIIDAQAGPLVVAMHGIFVTIGLVVVPRW